MEVNVNHEVDNLRFTIEQEGHLALLTYMRAGKNRIVFTHTEVPPALEGRGLANQLAHNALEFARSEELVVIPLCPFVAAYIRRHPEYAPLVLPGYTY